MKIPVISAMIAAIPTHKKPFCHQCSLFTVLTSVTLYGLNMLSRYTLLIVSE